MADIILTRPVTGNQVVDCEAQAKFIFNFPASDSTLARDGDDLNISFPDGTGITLRNFYTQFNEENLPTFELDGTEVAAADFFASMNEPDLMPAAGPGAASAAARNSRFNEYANSDLGAGLDRLDGVDYSPSFSVAQAASSFSTEAEAAGASSALAGAPFISDENAFIAPTISIVSIGDNQPINIARATNPFINVSGVAGGGVRPGDVVTVRIPGSDIEYTTQVRDDLTWEVQIPTQAIVDGEQIEASITIPDRDGNPVTVTDTVDAEVDVTPPLASITIDPVTGDDVLTDEEMQTEFTILTGTAGADVNPGDIVTITVAGNRYTTIVRGDLTWQVEVDTAALGSSREIEASVTTTDENGNPATATTVRGVEVAPAPSIEFDSNGIAGTSGILSTSDIALRDGGTDSAGSLTVKIAGGAHITATIDGQNFVPELSALISAAGSTFNLPEGTLIFRFNAQTGNFEYSFIQTAAGSHTGANDEVLSHDISIKFTDDYGQSADAPIRLDIYDDGPVIAPATPFEIAEDYTGIISGNAFDLITTGADKGGKFEWTSDGTSKYGQFTLNDDGTYSFDLAQDSAEVQGLLAGQTVTETLTFTYTDADGDKKQGSIAINITGKDNGFTIEPGNPKPGTPLDPAVTDGKLTVNEAGLPDGTDAGNVNTTAHGAMAITAPDGVKSITVHGKDIAIDGSATEIALTGGTLSVSFADGQLSYSFTLTGNVSHGDQTDGTNFIQNVNIVVTNNNDKTTESSLEITIVDDAPEINVNELGQVVDSGTNVTTGTWSHNFGADIPDAQTVTINDIQLGADKPVTVVGTHGTLTVNWDGTYSYKANPNASGTDTFTFTITDRDGDSKPATLEVEVKDSTVTPDAVTFTTSDADVATGSSQSVDVPEGFSIVDGEIDRINDSIEYGKFSIEDGKLVFTQDKAWTHEKGEDAKTFDSVAFKVTDANGNLTTLTATVTIKDDTTTMSFTSSELDLFGGTTYESTNPQKPGILTYDFGADRSDGKAIIITVNGVEQKLQLDANGKLVDQDIQGKYGILHIKADGKYAYTAQEDVTGVDEFKFSITDSDADSMSGSATGDPFVLKVNVKPLPELAFETDDADVESDKAISVTDIPEGLNITNIDEVNEQVKEFGSFRIDGDKLIFTQTGAYQHPAGVDTANRPFEFKAVDSLGHPLNINATVTINDDRSEWLNPSGDYTRDGTEITANGVFTLDYGADGVANGGDPLESLAISLASSGTGEGFPPIILSLTKTDDGEWQATNGATSLTVRKTGTDNEFSFDLYADASVIQGKGVKLVLTAKDGDQDSTVINYEIPANENAGNLTIRVENKTQPLATAAAAFGISSSMVADNIPALDNQHQKETDESQPASHAAGISANEDAMAVPVEPNGDENAEVVATQVTSPDGAPLPLVEDMDQPTMQSAQDADLNLVADISGTASESLAARAGMSDEANADTGFENLINLEGHTLFTGTDGNDFIDAGRDADAIRAGAGDDMIVYDPTDYLIDGGDGIDFLLNASSPAGSHTLAEMLANGENADASTPMVLDVEVMISGLDLTEVRTLDNLAEKCGLTLSRNESGDVTSVTLGDGWREAAQTQGESSHTTTYENGEITLETTLANISGGESGQIVLAIAQAQTSAETGM